MDIVNVIEKSREFAINFIDIIGDTSEQLSKRQVFFMDNQKRLKQCFDTLQKIANEELPEDIDDKEKYVNLADCVITNLKLAINKFQKELTISDNITAEETIPQLTEETLKDALKENKTTQEIAANMNAIANQNSPAFTPYNYALFYDGLCAMISADTKEKLNADINAVLDTGNYTDIKLFKVSYSPVEIKTKTVVTV